MSRRTIADIQRRWAAVDRGDRRRTAPTEVTSPTDAGIHAVVSRNGEGCLTHLVRYVVTFHPGYRPTHSAVDTQCGQSYGLDRVTIVDMAAEMFGCARCIAIAERYDEPTFNLIPTTGCEQSQGRRRGRRRTLSAGTPAGTVTPTTTTKDL